MKILWWIIGLFCSSQFSLLDEDPRCVIQDERRKQAKINIIATISTLCLQKPVSIRKRTTVFLALNWNYPHTSINYGRKFLFKMNYVCTHTYIVSVLFCPPISLILIFLRPIKTLYYTYACVSTFVFSILRINDVMESARAKLLWKQVLITFELEPSLEYPTSSVVFIDVGEELTLIVSIHV